VPVDESPRASLAPWHFLMDQPPTNQINSVYDYHSVGEVGGRHIAFRHLDANWYLWTEAEREYQ